jgi:hypothetical protein
LSTNLLSCEFYPCLSGIFGVFLPLFYLKKVKLKRQSGLSSDIIVLVKTGPSALFRDGARKIRAIILIFPPGLIVALAAKNIIIPQEATMSLFTGYKLRTPAGDLSEREQEALIKYVLDRTASQPATAHEVRLVLEGRLEAHDLSAGTLGALRESAHEFIVVGKPLAATERRMPRVRLTAVQA